MHEVAAGEPNTAGHGHVLDELRVEGLRVVHVEHAGALRLAGHAHEAAKICVVVRGGVSERCGLDVVSPGAFEPVLRPAAVAHANHYHAGGARSLLVEIDPGDARVRRAAEGRLSGRAAGRVLGARLDAAFRARRASRARLVLAAARALLDAFDAGRRPPAPSWLVAARETLARESIAPPPLDELAGGLGVHPVYLAQAFRARWGRTTRAFVRAHRVFSAMELVSEGASLAAAASAAGFVDQSHMTRAVREERGATPGLLRVGCS
jgi:AraC family transcriptional regulator